MKSLNLSQPVLDALAEMNIETASPIQKESIPHLLAGKDVIGQAQTGTGKTAAFAIPVIENTHIENKKVQTLVLCPTRELAIQVTAEFKKIAQFMEGIQVVSIYGGQRIEKQIKALKKRPQIVVGTPGRVKDMVNRSSLRLDAVKTVILDEADEMLNMGFRPDIEHILKRTPRKRQTVFFSATMPKAIMDLTQKYQFKAIHVKVAKSDQPMVKIEQNYFEVTRVEKMTAFMQLLNYHQFECALVFCNTKRWVDVLTAKLQKAGFSSEGLHGGKTQSQRDRIMQGFRKGKTQILVATDVAARGLDVDDVEAVINYDLPKDSEFYIHRIGRTGRAGKSGQSFTFVEFGEFQQLKEIRKYPSVNLSKSELPA